jgi:hypothetical protein
MKRILALFLAAILPTTAAAQPADIWARAQYGNVSGVEYVDLRGYNAATTTSFEPIWGESAAYTVLTAALSAPYCASTSASDDVGSTGLESAVVSGVTSSYAEFSETIAMDGQTSVVLSTSSIYFINSVVGTGAGSGFTNAGVVACGTGTNTSGDPAVIHSYMGTGYGRANTAMYAVPADHTMICRNFTLTSYDVTAAESVEFVLDTYYDPIADKVLNRRVLGHLNQAGASSVVVPDAITIPEKTVAIIQALSAASVGPISVSAECLLIEDAGTNNNQVYF